jgi:hypothetical protein
VLLLVIKKLACEVMGFVCENKKEVKEERHNINNNKY